MGQSLRSFGFLSRKPKLAPTHTRTGKHLAVTEPVIIDSERTLQSDEPPHDPVVGGWVHRAAMGTLPTFTTHQGVYAALPKENE